MEITYDKETDALYIEFQKGDFHKNQKINENLILDLDTNGNILGMEFINISKKIPSESLSQVNVKNIFATLAP